jgi:DNA primase
LHEDEIEFSNTIFQEIYIEIIHQLNQLERLDIDGLINHNNSEISSIVTSILMEKENPNQQLSNWERKNIEVKSEVEKLPKAVNDVVFNLRRVLIEKLVNEKSSENRIYSNEEKEEIMNYDSLRIRLFEKLNRVV